MTFEKRLLEALAGQSVNSFAKKSGIGYATLTQYLSGKSSPGLEKLIAISETAGVSLLWLATGQGTKHEESAPPDEILGIKATPRERAAIELFRAMSPQDQADVLAKMALMAEAPKGQAAADKGRSPATGGSREAI